jgi:hypothetical protein
MGNSDVIASFMSDVDAVDSKATEILALMNIPSPFAPVHP